jgi:hypothetical protein
VVNTDNRLLANAARLQWEPIFNEWVSEVQRGFLRGRSLLANVVDVDFEAMTVSLTSERGALILFDFKAAFPSESHAYLLEVLSHIGVPTHCLNFVKALYDSNRCRISCKGGSYGGFDISAGIRQGCPLSPLLFAVTVDILLRRYSKVIEGGFNRAFADDIAAVTKDFFKDEGKIATVFSEFAEISGLELSLPKTVVVPLWYGPPGQAEAEIRRAGGLWAQVQIKDSATYLGFAEGPGKGDKSWTKATKKYLDRAVLWGSAGLGLHYSTMTYNVFGVSTLTFVAQLETPPEDTLKAEEVALRKAAPGPMHWMSPRDSWHLSDLYGQTRSFTSIAVMAAAAQARVGHFEPLGVGANAWRTKAARLDRAIRESPYFDRRVNWAGWYDRSHVKTLSNNALSLAGQNITRASIEDEIAGGMPRPWTGPMADRIRRSFQRTVYGRILRSRAPDPVDRMRYKIVRWKLEGPPAVVARRVLANLQRLKGLVAPRVAAACLSALWNRWTTARRFQQRAAALNLCVLGCGGAAEDSIEHYVHCPSVRTVARGILRLGEAGPDRFFLAARGLGDEELACLGILVYAAYSATNLFRNRVGRPSKEVAEDALGQCCRNAVQGHSQSSRLLDGRWDEPLARRPRNGP